MQMDKGTNDVSPPAEQVLNRVEQGWTKTKIIHFWLDNMMIHELFRCVEAKFLEPIDILHQRGYQRPPFVRVSKSVNYGLGDGTVGNCHVAATVTTHAPKGGILGSRDNRAKISP